MTDPDDDEEYDELYGIRKKTGDRLSLGCLIVLALCSAILLGLEIVRTAKR